MIPELDHKRCISGAVAMDVRGFGRGLSNLVKALTLVKIVTGKTYGPDKYIDVGLMKLMGK
jgi:hypothetical protein